MRQRPTSPVRLGTLHAAIAAASLAACTNLLTPLGAEKYDCNRKEDPASPYCHSFRSVEKGTTGPLPDSRYDEVMRMSDYDRMTGIAPVGKARLDTPAVSATTQQPATQSAATPSESKQPPATEVPLRIGPLVQRVWVKRFVDGNDMLISDTRVYKEIVPAHWAGFSSGESSESPSGVAYPHRPAKSSADTPTKPSRDGAKPSTPGFVQPGARAEPADVANVPATPNGTPTNP
jgi:hypothetical protein